jgi:hypothetical protein
VKNRATDSVLEHSLLILFSSTRIVGISRRKELKNWLVLNKHADLKPISSNGYLTAWDGVIVASQEGKIVLCNQAVERIVGPIQLEMSHQR